MTKEEFLYELKKELSALDSAEAMAYNLRYYSDYIDAEIAKGRSEQEVLDELGNPRWLVNSIKESGDYGRVQDIIEGPLENVRSNEGKNIGCGNTCDFFTFFGRNLLYFRKDFCISPSRAHSYFTYLSDFWVYEDFGQIKIRKTLRINRRFA